MTEETPSPAERPVPTSDQQNWSVLAHASALIQLLGPPSVVGPLVVWLLRRDDPLVAPHARAALNFQLSLLIYFVLGIIVAFVAALTIVGLILSALIVFFLIGMLLLELVFAVLGAVAASRGELYSYPFSLELIKG
ncbi:MAG: DUF4870 domain-containing protein [Acidimicrobiia bacterium]